MSDSGPLNPAIRIVPGTGWGDGSHPTTRLCLRAIAYLAQGQPAALDFGSGSGILSIAAARLGARVDAVEIDPVALASAAENLRLNGVLPGKVRFARSLDELTSRSYPLIVANILRPVLLEFAAPLCSRLESRGSLILSGLVNTDIPDVSVRYSSLLGFEPQVYSQEDWRMLVWKGGA